MEFRPSRRSVVLAFGAVPVVLAGDSSASSDPWDSLRTGRAIALMRHAVAPGIGDPVSFKLDDCSTQRMLSGEGRSQARDVGLRLRTRGILRARVVSSRWCRALETAELLGFGAVQPLAALDSFFSAPDLRDSRTRQFMDWLAEQAPSPPLICVTHQVNIAALTGVAAGSGDIVVASRSAAGPLQTLGRIRARSAAGSRTR
jgi:broad specificity phosphatase PhoE